jgi:hypothetical protein
VLGNGKGGSVLDYVTCWYAKACEYTHDRNIPIAFVSTNSITQGEQPAELWPILRARSRHQIAFAHRTFAWRSDARNPAHVHVVILGLSETPPAKRILFDVSDDQRVTRAEVDRINAYLIDAEDIHQRGQ